MIVPASQYLSYAFCPLDWIYQNTARSSVEDLEIQQPVGLWDHSQKVHVL